jgi:Sec-independent protein translocase protein TatA
MAMGPQQLIIVGVLFVIPFVILFGARRFASLGTGLGQGIRKFKNGLSGVEDAARIDVGDDKR